MPSATPAPGQDSRRRLGVFRGGLLLLAIPVRDVHLLGARAVSEALQAELLRAEAEAVAPRLIETLSDADFLALLPPALE